MLVSLAAVGLFMAVGWPLIVYYTGWAGLVKFWLMPWLGYHFWMSTFTLVHHTAPHIPFKPAGEWNAAKAQLSGTVHCDYPRWVEFLCFDINVHVPHHVMSKIPWYNLRAATDSECRHRGRAPGRGPCQGRFARRLAHMSFARKARPPPRASPALSPCPSPPLPPGLRQNWGEYMTEASINWRLLRGVCTQCHVYDTEKNYVPFDAEKEEPLFGFWRRVMPDSM